MAVTLAADAERDDVPKVMTGDRDRIRPDIVVTLVHGTYSPWAGWAGENSKFRRGVSEGLSKSEVEFVRFKWISLNAAWARRHGARRLANRLRLNLDKWPLARHCVVAHSHGGAVALGAFEVDPTLVSKVSVATLATPFIAFRRRGLMGAKAESASIRLWGASLAAFTGFTLGLISMFVFHITWAHPLPMLSGLVVLSLVLASVVRRLTPTVSQRADRIAATLQTGCACRVVAGVNLHIIRTVGDEASAVLAVSRFVAWCGSRFWWVLSWALSPLSAFDRWFRRRYAGGPDTVILLAVVMGWQIVAGGIVMSSLMGVPSSDPLYLNVFRDLKSGLMDALEDPTLSNLVGAAVIGVIIVGAVLAVTTLLVWLIFVAIAAVLFPMFGSEAALTALAWEVSEEPVPDGSWIVHQFSSDGSDGGALDLAHGLSYEDERVHAHLAHWIATVPLG